jgi:hypothetical protein
MRTAWIAGFACVATLLAASASEAGNYRSKNIFWNYYDYPWCFSDMEGMTECSYATFEQCYVTRQGVGGTCSPNPRYVYVPADPRGRRKSPSVYR